MDCSLGSTEEATQRNKLMVMAVVAGWAVRAILDMGCDQTLVKAGLVSGDEGTRVNSIKMLCLNGQISTYPRQRVQVTIQGVTTEMSVGITVDLPCQMILVRDWPEIYEVLEDKQTQGDWRQGLLGEGTNED